MSRTSASKAVLLSLAILGAEPVFAADNLLVYVFKNGIVQADVEVIVNGQSVNTNRYGQAVFELPAGSYEVGFVSAGEQFAATQLSLIEDVQSQVFLQLTSDGLETDLDLPLSSLEQRFEQDTVKALGDGPTGELALTVTESDLTTPIANAKIFFRGYDVEGQTDADGVATLTLPEGEYDLSIVHPSYVMSVKKGVKVKADATQSQPVALASSDFVMEEYVVSAPVVEGGLASAIIAMRDSDVVGDTLSAEQFSKSGDSSVADALKRVTGVTIVDGQYVYIRGLGERYTSVLLNDLEVPSPEPTRRVVPLDIFPTGVIQNMQIQKTWSSDLPGTFAGGSLRLYSRDIPEEDNYIKGSLGLQWNDSTGDSALRGEDNREAVPGLLLNLSNNFSPLTEQVVLGSTVIAQGLTSEQKEALNTAMMNYRRYGSTEHDIQPGIDTSLSVGQSFKTGGGLKYGFAGTGYVKTKEELDSIQSDRYQTVLATGNTVHLNSSESQELTLNEKYGVLASFGVEDPERHGIKYTLLWLSEFTDTTLTGTREELVENDSHDRTYLSYTEEEVLAHQLNGQSQFEDILPFYDAVSISWGLETAEATRLEPGTFEYEYKEASGAMVLDAKKMFYLYSDLEDQVDNYRIDIELPFKFNGQENATRFGLFEYEKSRNLDNRRFKVEYQNTADPRPIDSILTTASVESGDADILDSYKPDDFYSAEQTISAYYLSQQLSVLPQLDINAGARWEDSTQSLRVGAEQEQYTLDTSDTLPAFGATYRFNEEWQGRFGYSETITRPDFREFSPNRYKDPRTGYIVFGFPELKYTTIENTDLKLEWYPSYNEFITFGIFTKDFVNPIETVRSQADVDIEITYRNARSATANGLEFGFRKTLMFLGQRWQNWYVAGNYTDIDSEIELDKGNPDYANDSFVQDLTSDDRPMQGQSPYVVNLQLGFDNLNTGRSAVLSYNEFGERIASLGINGNPDIYEQPFEKLDFTVKWRINDTFDAERKRIGYGIAFKIENLLNSEVVWKQGSDEVLREEVGRAFKLSFDASY